MTSLEQQRIERAEQLTFIYAMTLVGSVAIYGIGQLIWRRYKYTRHPIVPAKIADRWMVRYVCYRRVMNDFHWFHVISYTIFILVLLGFLIAATPDQTFILKTTGTFLSPLIVLTMLLPLRHTPFTWALQIAYNRLFIPHRWVAYLVTVLSILHTIAYLVNWSRPELQNHPLTGRDLFIPFPARTFGTLSTIVLFIIITTSFEWVRRRSYNTFKISHFLVYIFNIFVAIHRPYHTYWAVSILGFVMLDYVLYTIRGTCILWEAHGSTDGEQMVKLQIPRGDRFQTYSTGQHVYINIPSLSHWQWHPFTIASAPGEPHIELGIRSLGDYTHQLVTYVDTHPTFTIRVYGPFGKIPFRYKRYNELLLLATGIGITPHIAILRDLFLFPTMETVQTRKVHLFWICSDYKSYQLYSETIESALKASECQWKMPDLYVTIFIKAFDTLPLMLQHHPMFQPRRDPFDMGVEIFDKFQNKYPRAISSDLEQGPSTKPLELTDHRDMDYLYVERRVLASVSGSNSFIRSAWDHIRDRTTPMFQIDFYREEFLF
jgi:predicted ferric reductase